MSHQNVGYLLIGPEKRATNALLREFQQVRQLIDNLIRGILAKAKALLALGNDRQAGSLTRGNARNGILNAAAAIRGQPQQSSACR